MTPLTAKISETLRAAKRRQHLIGDHAELEAARDELREVGHLIRLNGELPKLVTRAERSINTVRAIIESTRAKWGQRTKAG